MTEIAMAKVRDLNARDEAREHDLVAADGSVKRYRFEPRQHTEMPLALATRWLVGNIGFEVLGPDGQRLALVPQAQQAAQGPGLVLRPDQVVASLDELRLEALLVRANAAGGKFARTAGKRRLIEFLLDEGPAPAEQGGSPRSAPIDDTPEGEKLGQLEKAA